MTLASILPRVPLAVFSRGAAGCRRMGTIAAAAMLLAAGSSAAAAERLSLAGEWQIAAGAPAPAFPQASRPAITYRDTILLPGTTETRGKGPQNSAAESGMLTRVRKFDGPAWYERMVDIPPDWAGRHIVLELERTKYTQVWWDDQAVGEKAIYTAPQHYDLTSIARPGRHRLTVMVDNRAERRPVQAEAHQFSDNTQTNWNGLLGRLELASYPARWIEDVRVYADVPGRRFRVRVGVAQLAGVTGPAEISVHAVSFNHPGEPHRPTGAHVSLDPAAGGGSVDLLLGLGQQARAWDEFSPALYRLTVTLDSPAGRDERTVEAGWREFGRNGSQFAINGRTTFLRGRHDGCVFPLTGHPPMDLDGWLEYLRVCLSYGINHVRCHTWVPPEAAFAAADRLGIYLQPELPFWGTFDARARDFLWPEGEATLRAYGNHASFVMMTLGNEMGGDREMMNTLVSRLREFDPRHLYSDGSNNVLWDPRLQPTNDFWTSAKTKTPASGDRAVPVRGSFYHGDGNDGVVQWGAAPTRSDLREGIAGIPVPVLGHEIAQYTVYPDFHELAAFTGVTRPRNLERFRALLERQGRLEQAKEFSQASGRLAASLYREEIELALRTPGFGGFQLLDLQDFPGQGTALVGMLDAFMQSKGLITPHEWRRFCSPQVPLARFDRYTWTTGDTFAADLEFAHYGPSDLPDAAIGWTLRAAGAAPVAQGRLEPRRIVQGGLRSLGRIEVPLASLQAPARYELAVTVSSGAVTVSNQWPLWVYPADAGTAVPPNVQVVTAFDERAKALLAGGARVVLMPDAAHRGYVLRGAYATDFWCWPMFRSSPGTMGLLCDPRHPALAAFPTAAHSERQWSAIAHASSPFILTGAPAGLRPIVQVIDNLERNDLLGLVFEAKVGLGSLLVVGCDLAALGTAPEARQLWSSLLAYAGSERFAPRTALEVSFLDQVLRPALTKDATVTASSSFRPPWGFVPEPAAAIDGDINTPWRAADEDRAPWVQVDLGRVCDVDTVELLWESEAAGYRYQVEGSLDARDWTVLSDQRGNAFAAARHRLAVPSRPVRHVRIAVAGWPADGHASLRDLRVLGSPRPR